MKFMVASIFIALCTYSAYISEAKCPRFFYPIADGCYIFIQNVGISWFNSTLVCQQFGGYLANIDSQEEEQALRAYHAAREINTSLFWIGASDLVESEWRWTHSGRAIDNMYNNWAAIAPLPSYGLNCSYWNMETNLWRAFYCEHINGTGAGTLCEADPVNLCPN